MRHGAVREAEQDAVERFRRLIIARVAMHQSDVAPLVPIAELARPRQHSGGQIDAIDVARIADRLSQIGQIPPGAAADFQDPVSGLQSERRDRLLAKSSRNKQQPFEEGNEPSQTIIAPRNECAVAIDPCRHGTPPRVSYFLFPLQLTPAWVSAQRRRRDVGRLVCSPFKKPGKS
jgi:hypothetical protein